MRQNYKIFLTSLIIFTLIVTSGLLLFGAIGADPVETTDCNPERMDWECPPRGDNPIYKPCPKWASPGPGDCQQGYWPENEPVPICPISNLPPCPHDAAE